MITTFDHVAVGDELEPFVDAPLTVTDFVRYQGASGDMNPIHHDTEFATASGFAGPFAVGMLQAGIAATYLTDRFGPESVRSFRVQWREVAWPGDVLTYQGEVVGKREDGDGGLVDVEFRVVRQTGAVHLKGWASVWLPA